MGVGIHCIVELIAEPLSPGKNKMDPREGGQDPESGTFSRNSGFRGNDEPVKGDFLNRPLRAEHGVVGSPGEAPPKLPPERRRPVDGENGPGDHLPPNAAERSAAASTASMQAPRKPRFSRTRRP